MDVDHAFAPVILDGESLTIVPTLTGSVEGLDMKLESLDPATGATGQADLGDTRGYTADWRRTAVYTASPPASGNFPR